ncbi:hypothetical protein ACOHYD_11015 [Desulfobacterota bacterium M19]
MKKASYDFYLIIATAAVLGAISAICIYGMFYFKFAELQHMPAAAKALYMTRMNRLISPFIIALILLLGICVPKRLLAARRLTLFAALLALVVIVISSIYGVVTALKVSLIITLALQFVVLILAAGGSHRLNFNHKSYWLRVGSSLMHLGIILFILDLFFYKHHALHLILFWVTTISTVSGMLACFYSQALLKFFRGKGEHYAP